MLWAMETHKYPHKGYLSLEEFLLDDMSPLLSTESSPLSPSALPLPSGTVNAYLLGSDCVDIQNRAVGDPAASGYFKLVLYKR